MPHIRAYFFFSGNGDEFVEITTKLVRSRRYTPPESSTISKNDVTIEDLHSNVVWKTPDEDPQKFHMAPLPTYEPERLKQVTQIAWDQRITFGDDGFCLIITPGDEDLHQIPGTGIHFPKGGHSLLLKVFKEKYVDFDPHTRHSDAAGKFLDEAMRILGVAAVWTR